MNQIFFQPRILAIRPVDVRSTPCTALIPSSLLKRLKVHRYQLAMPGFSMYLRRLIRKFRFSAVMGCAPGETRMVPQYQSGGLLLTRIHFRPEPELWHQVTMLARYLGLSRCRLIVLMIEWDLGLVPPPSQVGVPTGLRGGLQDHECLILVEKIHTWGDKYSKAAMIGLDPDVLDAYLESPYTKRRWSS